MSLTVLSVAYPFAPVSPDSVGGAEQVLAAIDAALVAAGHRSLVLAASGSSVRGTLMPLPPVPPSIDDRARARAHAIIRAALIRARADVIHLHGIDYPACLPPAGTRLDAAIIATLHLPPDWYDAAAGARHDVFRVPVSAAQHRACPPGPGLLPPIPNGVPLHHFAAPHARRRFALMLGRVCPEKGQHLALRAAHAANIDLLLAGTVFSYPEHQAYFREQVAPLLDSRRRWIGPAGLARKRRLLGTARCVLVPSLAAETSSLVAMEAAAAGTPVIAFRAGALPETVEHGRTGLVVDDVAGMADAIGRIGVIDPRACRETARRRFDQRRMTDAYLALYRRVTEQAMAA